MDASVGSGTINISFVDADIRQVIKSVIGDALGLDFRIDPGVQGKVTLRTGGSIPRDEAIGVLRSSIEPLGFSLIRAGGLVEVLPTSEAAKRKSIGILDGLDLKSDTGYSTQIFTPKNISAIEAQRVVEQLNQSGGKSSVDRNRNLLLLTGTGSEIQSMLDIVETFDVDWLSAMSFALYTPSVARVNELIPELEAIFSRPGSPSEGLVEFIPIGRLNAILVLSPRETTLRSVARWIRRLDRAASQSDRRLYFYRVQNGDATEIAESLTSIFGGGTSRGFGLGESAANGSTLNVSLSEGGANRTSGIADITDGGSRDSAPRIVAERKNNALIIFATGRQFRLIQELLNEIDIAPEQVLIEAYIAEVQLNEELRYGVQGFFQNAESTFTLSELESGVVTPRFPGFAYSYIGNSARAALSAISSVTDLDMISAPKLVVLDNETARLEVGDEVPVTTQTSQSVLDPDAPLVSTIQYRDTGVILEVTPRINNSGLVTLEISQEVSDVVPTVTSEIDSPTIQQRIFQSRVVVGSGQTVALGGLIRTMNSDTRSGIPILKDIPVMGALFRSTEQDEERTELLVFITPRVLRSVQDTVEITRDLKNRLLRLRPALVDRDLP